MTGGDTHVHSCEFQSHIKHSNNYQADGVGLLLGHERNAALEAAVSEQAKKDQKSFRERVNAKKKFSDATTAKPPTSREMWKCRIYIAGSVLMPNAWLATLSQVSGVVTRTVHSATIFVASNPSNPCEPIITWAAFLMGAWVVSPPVFVGQAGPSIKYMPSILVKRKVWASGAFRAEHPLHWLASLEILSGYASMSQWTLLASAADWAHARAHAEKIKAPSGVIAFVSVAEAGQMSGCHAFDVSGAIGFLAHLDSTRGSLGLLGM